MKISIKIKWTVFIILLLILNLLIISFFMLKGIENNQRQSYEAFLKDSSKTINLYIRESFLSSNSKDFEKFYIENAKDIIFDLEGTLNLHTTLYDKNGYNIGSNIEDLQSDIENKKKIKIIKKALNNNIVYKKNKDKIIYLAPVYDFEKQIGILELEYYTDKEDIFYKQIKTLFLKVGLCAILITFLLAHLYFSKVANNIALLKKAIKKIEKGNYESAINLDKNDELGDLSKGIYFMSNKISENIQKLKIEREKQKEFIGNITHEFKTPLTVIKAQMDLMTLYKDDEEMVYRSKEIAEKELKRLDDMVENILYLSKFEKYDFEFKKEKINTKKLLMDIADRMKGKAFKYDIEIIQDTKDAYILIDSESFMQIFINLIDNAIKYNVAEGKIYIRSYNKENKNYIEIEDTGIGIPQEYKSKIFEPFYIIDKNRSKKFSGTGLGLSLVNKIVKKQNGSIRIVDSKIGTCFQVSFPLYES